MNILQICSVLVVFGPLMEAVDYCKDVGPVSSRDMTLGDIEIQGVFPSAIYADKLCAAGLRDLTATHIVELNVGESYVIEWGSKTCLEGNSSKGQLWIDWPGLGWKTGVVYTDDLISSFSSHYGDFEAVTEFTVPANAAVGVTRMRAMVMEYYEPEDYDPRTLHPCSKFTHGGATDFSVNVTKPGHYCMNTGPSSDLDTTLGPVTIAGAQGSGFTSEKYCGAGLNDLSKTHTVKLIVGQTYSITWGSHTCGNVFYTSGQMWIDWKNTGWSHNGIYPTDPITPTYGEQNNWQQTTEFTVPSDAVVGHTRMRGMVIEDTDPSNLHPCHTFAFGGTTDFGVEIIASTDN